MQRMTSQFNLRTNAIHLSSPISGYESVTKSSVTHWNRAIVLSVLGSDYDTNEARFPQWMRGLFQVMLPFVAFTCL